MGIDLGRLGVWSMELRFGDPGQRIEAAAELDELGYGAVWIPGGIDDRVLGDVDALLSAGKRIAVATGIVNIWKQEPEDVAAWFTGLSPDLQARVMLGIGISHGPIIGEAWGKPIAKTRGWVEAAKAAGIPADNLCVAALGPKMLELASATTAGAHPYLITPEHTAIARETMGPGALLAPEQGVVLESDPARARELARQALDTYRRLPNYCNSWLRLGFTQEDIETASDRLIDGLFAWGGVEEIGARVQAHFDAGADHVCLQVITGAGLDIAAARPVWRELAALI